MKLDAELKARLTPEMKKELKRAARQESKRKGIPVSQSELAREWIADRLNQRKAA